jgi:Ni/Co efflux regulator RcnB
VFGSPWYILLSITAIIASALVWDRFFKQRPERRDGRRVRAHRTARDRDRPHRMRRGGLLPGRRMRAVVVDDDRRARPRARAERGE